MFLLVVQLLGRIDFLLHEAAHALCERVDVFGLVKVHAGLSQMRKKGPRSIGGETRALVYDLDAHDSRSEAHRARDPEMESRPCFPGETEPAYTSMDKQNTIEFLLIFLTVCYHLLYKWTTRGL